MVCCWLHCHLESLSGVLKKTFQSVLKWLLKYSSLFKIFIYEKPYFVSMCTSIEVSYYNRLNVEDYMLL